MNIYGCFFIVFERGEGCCVWDIEGKEYFDFVVGIVICIFGYVYYVMMVIVLE